MSSLTISGRRSARGPAAAALIARFASEFRATARTSAPASRSASAVSRWPKNAARWSGDQPSWAHCPTRAGCSRGGRGGAPADVGAEPEGAGFEEARAGPALEQEAHDVVLAEIRRDQQGRVAALVARAGEMGVRRGGTAAGLRVAASNGAEQVGDSAHDTSSGGSPGRRLRLQEGRGRRERLIPGAGEAALGALLRERPRAVPLAAGLLVVDLEPVSVGIREIDADRDRVVGDADRDVLVLEPLVHLAEILEVRHAPGDVIQADLLLLG